MPRHIDQLMAILRDDHDARHVRAMVGAFRDPDALVRNNAMRVVADIAHHHAELRVPIEPVLEALDYPSTTDRNKASAILVGLLERPSSGPWKSMVRQRSGETLLRMLELQQPNNHDFAYRSLELISGRTYGERDYAAWAAWLAEPLV